jgi:hypothetical protein
MSNTQIYITDNTEDILSVCKYNNDNCDNLIYFHYNNTFLSYYDNYVDDIIKYMKDSGFKVNLRQISYISEFCIEFYNKNKCITHHFNITCASIIYTIMKYKGQVGTIIIKKNLEQSFDKLYKYSNNIKIM